MKVCLLGPVVTKMKTGGVATFVESMADAFQAKGMDTIILTNYSDKKYTDSHTPIKSFNCNKINYIRKSMKYLKKNSYDLIIGSTWYDMSLAISSHIPGEKIHYLHGFGVPKDGLLKAIVIAINDKMRRKNCKLVSNSNFTKMINEVFFRTKVDQVIPIGISPQFSNIGKIKAISERKYDVIYVGRIRQNKGVDKIIKASAYVEKTFKRKLHIAIVGDGPQYEEIKSLSNKLNVEVDYVGKVGIKDTIEYYMNSKVFVSLDWKEPYGQTYAEALVCGCRIVCPTSGGEIEYLSSYPEYFQSAIADDEKAVGEAIYTMMNQTTESVDSRQIYQKHSYERVVAEILDYLG